MNISTGKHLLNHCLLFVFTLILIFGCGSGGSSPDSSSPGDSAALVFQLKFQPATNQPSNAFMPQAADPDVCNDYLIETIRVEVYRSSDDSVATSVERPCSAHGLAISNLPAGVNLYLVCKGLVGQQTRWQGQVGDISLSAGETRDLGPIVMDYAVGDERIPPEVVSAYPADGAEDVDLNASITVGFNEPLAPSSVSDDAIIVTSDGTAIAGTVSYDPTAFTVSFTPQSLSAASTYTFTLKATADDHVTDTTGMALIGDFSWQFTTAGGSVDTTPPQVISAAPTSDSAALDATVQATFNEPMDPDSLNNTVFTLSSAQGAVGATVAYNADTRTVTLTPGASLAPATQYTATISTNARDVSGNALDAPYSWTFTTLTPQHTLTVNKNGTGSGTVSSTPAGIGCGTTCSHDFDDGATVTLDAVAAGDSTFTGWSGAGCSGTGTCQVTMNAEATVTASFERTYTVTATAGSGGRISPQGTIEVIHGENQAFTITADAGYSLTGLIVDGTPVTPVASYEFTSVSGNHSIEAVFEIDNPSTPQHTLTVNENGSGTGTVTSTPGGIDCGTGCSHDFDEGTAVTLEAVAAGDSTFTGWSGAGCSGTGACQVTMNADATVTAVFERTYTIEATAGSGGQISPQGTIQVTHGENQAFTITADAGRYLADLIIDGASVTPAASYEFTSVSANHSIEAVFAPVWHVDAAATGGDGLSWSTAFATVQDAVNAAADGQDIWIRAGTYTLANQIIVNKAVKIYGGFSGTEQFRHQRDRNANPVVISGNDTTRCLYISADAIISGVILQDGYLDGYSVSYGDPIQGGGIYIDHAAPQLSECKIINHNIECDGGCFEIEGGAVYVINGQPVFSECDFENNVIGNSDLSFGGTIFLENSDTTIIQCRFNNNSAYHHAGAIYIQGGTMSIRQSLFDSNVGLRGGRGGAISQGNNATSTIDGCTFLNNKTTGEDTFALGGAIYNHSSNMTVMNSIFMYNSADSLLSSGSEVEGGAIANSMGLADDTSSLEIHNCTLVNNSVTSDGSARGGGICNYSELTMTNTIAWGNGFKGSGTIEGGQIYNGPNATFSVTACNINQGGFDETNINQDPLLDSNGHLRANSPCIDRGDNGSAPDTDIDGESRPNGGYSDIGADEYHDTDSDGQPDYWELRYGLNQQVDDSQEDLDSDGVNNLFEYRFDMDPATANPVADTADRGFYTSEGSHDASDKRVITGFNADRSLFHRAYLTFDLSSVSGTVADAVLRLEFVEYQGNSVSERSVIYDVATGVDVLEASADGSTDIYDDLGSGINYGQINVTPADINSIIEIRLSAEAVDAINTSLGGRFAIGIEKYGGAPGLMVFGQSSEPRVHQLVFSME